MVVGADGKPVEEVAPTRLSKSAVPVKGLLLVYREAEKPQNGNDSVICGVRDYNIVAKDEDIMS